MKRILILLLFPLVLLVAPFSLPAYEGSPAVWKTVPECIWAPATGGGTWVTEVQIINYELSTNVNAVFYYNGGVRGPFTLYTTFASNHVFRTDNILGYLDSIDSGTFDYYGKVGAICFYATSISGTGTRNIHVQAHTKNGNYGKTFPGLSIVLGNTAAYNRNMRILGLVNNTTYRTFVGCVNTSDTTEYSVTFEIRNASNEVVGQFIKVLVPSGFQAFNPFVQAGIGSGSYIDCFLNIIAYSIQNDEWGRGIMSFGAVANNTSNDPAALLAMPLNVTE